MRIIICGAHPDDPESGCGGLAAKYSKAGQEVILVHFSCGVPQKQFQGCPHTIVREEEACRAAETLGTEVDFLGFDDGNIPMTAEIRGRVAEYLEKAEPDIVVAHWPVDTHPDHQATGNMVLRAYLQQQKWALYFFEVFSGKQTLCFNPTHYVDITEMEAIKQRAGFCHQSQDITSWYSHHEQMNQWRGYEAGVKAAEAFVACPRGFSLPRLLNHRADV